MRNYARQSKTARRASATLIVALSLLLVAGQGTTGAATVTQAVVREETVTTAPYDLTIAPNGEFQVLHFDAGLVSSVLVAKPWLLTVLIQDGDVVLQARATSGDTQLVAYVGGTGTLWHVTIGPHAAAPMRILVQAPGAEPVTAAVAPVGVAPQPSASPRPMPQTSGPVVNGQQQVAAFLGTLSAEQRAGFEKWQKNPSGEGLSDWLATLSQAQQDAFTVLVQEHVIAVPSVLGAPSGMVVVPPIVDTTTVIGGQAQSPALQTPQASHPVPPAPPAPATAVAAASPLPVQPGTVEPASATGTAASIHPTPTSPLARVLKVAVTDVPAGVTVTATAVATANGIEIRYAIHNGLDIDLGNAQVTATDASGNPVTATGIPANKIGASTDFSGSLVVQANGPVTLVWTWERWRHTKMWFVRYDLPNGTIKFVIRVS